MADVGETILVSYARVVTGKADRYLKQLCVHFDRKARSTFDETSGRTYFEFGACEMRAELEALVLKVWAADDERLTRVEDVVGGHLERFGNRDGLTVSWSRAGISD